MTTKIASYDHPGQLSPWLLPQKDLSAGAAPLPETPDLGRAALGPGLVQGNEVPSARKFSRNAVRKSLLFPAHATSWIGSKFAARGPQAPALGTVTFAALPLTG